MKECLVCGSQDGPFEDVEFVEVESANASELQEAFESGDTSSAPICLHCIEAMEAEVVPTDPESMH